MSSICCVCKGPAEKTTPICVLCEDCWDEHAGGGTPPNVDDFVGASGAAVLRELANQMEAVDPSTQHVENKEHVAEAFIEFMTQLCAVTFPEKK